MATSTSVEANQLAVARRVHRVRRLRVRAATIRAARAVDTFVMFGRQHMDHLVSEYVEHYHHERPHQSGGIAAAEQVEQERERAEREADDDQHASELREPALDRRGLRLLAPEEAGDVSQFRLRPRRGDDGPGAAGDDGGPYVDHVGAVRERRVGGVGRVCELVDRGPIRP